MKKSTLFGIFSTATAFTFYILRRMFFLENLIWVLFIYKIRFTRMNFYDILYLKFNLEFGKGDSFGRNDFCLAFRDHCGDRSGSRYGGSRFDLVCAVCMYRHGSGAL